MVVEGREKMKPGEGLGAVMGRDEGMADLELVSRYARTWRLLLQYDEDRLPVSPSRHSATEGLRVDEVRQAIATMKRWLMERGEAIWWST